MNDESGSTLPLSVAIICCNSERTIERTLASVADFAREIICIDSGSTDSTLDICRRYGATCHYEPWEGHKKQKQHAIERCTQPWILALDSDESLEPELQQSVVNALQKDDPSIVGYRLNRKVYYKGKLLNHAWQPELRLRLIRRGKGRWGGYDPHDRMELADSKGKVGLLQGDLRHDSFADIFDYLRKQIEHSRAAASSYRQMGRSTGPLRLITSPCGAWLKQIILKSAWRDGWRGWAAASGTAVAALMKHLILLEQTNLAREEKNRD
ncbi:MAG TPA: glycosyltransferase family 2 protein [Phycisphaeraceae bacterium]|nr:glycosyltransferase family 2 protein [Phycisphaeraceae bacterium]